MAAHDQLPPELRQLLNYAPIKIASETVLAYYRQAGLPATLAWVRQNIDAIMAHPEQERAHEFGNAQRVLQARKQNRLGR